MRTRRTKSSSDSGSPSALPGEGGHISVLLHESLRLLDIRQNDTVVDATLGGAGHAQEILKRLGGHGKLFGFDLDSEAIERAKRAVGSDVRVNIIHSNFRSLEKELRSRGVASIDKILFDLGWSSYQLSAGRGFSFLSDDPLLMTYGDGNLLTAADIVNEWEEGNIADVLYGWGGERYSRRIARAIVERRATKAFATASELAATISSATPAVYRHGRIHPATKTFQALRIAVNDELGALSEGLRGACNMLAPGGRIAVITFHSIEDKMVKEQLRTWERDGNAIRVIKKPISPSAEELTANPRSRSAKLRVIEKK